MAECARRSRARSWRCPVHVTDPWAGDDVTGQSIKRVHRKAAAGSIGQWPTSKCENPSLRWAGVDGRSVNRLFRCVAMANALTESGFPPDGRLFATEDKIVAMDHLGAARVSENQQHVGRGASFDLFGIVGV